MLKNGNYRVWVEPWMTEYIGDFPSDNLGDVFIFVEYGRITGLYCSSGKIKDIYPSEMTVDELEELIKERGDVVFERADDTESMSKVEFVKGLSYETLVKTYNEGCLIEKHNADGRELYLVIDDDRSSDERLWSTKYIYQPGIFDILGSHDVAVWEVFFNYDDAAAYAKA